MYMDQSLQHRREFSEQVKKDLLKMEIFYKMGLFMESIVLDAQFSIIWNLKLNVKKLTLVYYHGQIDYHNAGHHRPG